MKTVARGERFRVIDDFLEAPDLAQIRNLMADQDFQETPSVVYPESDGSAFRSRGAVLRHDMESESAQGGTVELPRAYGRVVRELHSHSDMFGVPGEDWSIVGFSFWKYSAGSRLGWHNDVAAGRRGEFVFFLHDEWKASWAGELLLLDTDPGAIEIDESGMSPLEIVEAKVSVAPPCLTAIVPKPNRLVLVEEGTIHCIQRVDRTAGRAVRRTMTGFVASKSPGETGSESRKIDRLVSLLGSE
ncbi:2OG-Fe(II) oxygenase [Streptomyces sp. WMMB 322]|uniref:2OG-Fe(II) oxygenase n=1 Tax=Streptomyces sp. WMMB 322 TaxID=1286821 RepID=UPI0006E3C6AA|nr:2OG-Fe(II) oxygenase [Streptomyces sp. WMMB 322]SCK13805.1 2OG-Fe(II) oxygenase superfamily protein [Streptomyces sp. WMMB 322]